MASWWNWNPTAEFSLNPLSWGGLGAAGEFGVFKNPGEEGEASRKKLLQEQAAAAGNFAGVGEAGYSQLGADARSRMDYLRRVAGGGESISGQQLRQGTQALQGQQRSMAAAAAPRDAAGAAHSAALNSARLGYGMSGQAALAGLQERRDAEAALSGMTMGMRGQDLQAALGSRQNATTGYGAGNAGVPEKSAMEKYGPAIIGAIAASDRDLKTNIQPADDAAKARLEGLQAYAYKYKNPGKHGDGEQLGVMAQDLEKAGLGQAVINTPEGKMVHGAKLAGANTAMLAALAKRVSKIEGGKKKGRK